MNIAFVANGKKTQLFYEISIGIQKEIAHLNVFFICCSITQYDYYIKKGINKSNLLLINWDIRNGNEKEIGEYKLNELAGFDRGMKYYFNDGIKYLTNLQAVFYNFVEKNNLTYIFGEMTWAHEILMNRICRDKFRDKCYYLHPQSIRIPNGRFCFMDTEFQDSIFSKSEYVQPESVLDGFDLPIKPVVPQRVADVAADVKHSMSLSVRLRMVLNTLIFNRIKKYDTTPENLNHLILPGYIRRKKKFMSEVNKFYYMNFLKKSGFEEFKDKKFVFVTLHMQPEASIDVVGRYFDDQFVNIKNIWRVLPNDVYLVVKEHTNAIGNRGRAFFKSLKRLNNVIIADENISSHLLLNHAICIFTNSGTVALEAALFGKNAFLFSSIFFDKLKGCHHITLEDFKQSRSLYDLIESCKIRDNSKMDLMEYSKYILRSSFAGVVDPHRTSPLWEDPKNISTIASSFVSFLNKVR